MSNEQVNQKSLEIEVSQALNAVFQQMNGQGEMLIGNIIAVSSMADLLIESGIITKEDFEAKVNDNRERVIEEIQIEQEAMHAVSLKAAEVAEKGEKVAEDVTANS